MMKSKKLFYGIAILSLIGLSLFIWNNYQIQVQERPVKPIKLPPRISGECGMQNCHGLDITCGFVDVPQACDMMYMAGDNCRQYASCQVVNGQCKLEKTSKFDSCKSCVEKCERDYKNDPDNVFECESKCAEATTPKVGVPCGGWDTFGEVVCKCSGQLEKYTCPQNTMCDSGTDTCYGSCEECKCYQGLAKGGVEVSCNGKDKLFK